MPFMPSSAMASASRNSVLRPPLPLPFSVIVVSPPEISTQGGTSGWPRMAHCRAMPAWTRATSRDSPSIESPRMTGVTPALRATSAAASSEACGVAIMMFSTPRKPRDRRASASRRRSCSRLSTLAGTSISYFSMMASASLLVEGSGTVGPEAMIEGSSPGTSEIISATTLAGDAAAASLPPLIAERCFRTVFISLMVAPDLSSALFTACLSSRLTPSARQVRAAPSRRRR